MESTDQYDAVRRLVAARAPGSVGLAGEVTVGWLGGLCAAARDSLQAMGSTIMVMSSAGDGDVVSASDRASVEIGDLQPSLGEGPGLDAFAARRPVLQPDLGPTAYERWPAYTPAVVAHGVCAVFAFPLQIGAVRLGVLEVHRGATGSLSSSELSLALTLVDVAVDALLDGQARSSDGDVEPGLATALDRRSEVYQAQGMVMVDLGVSLADAAARLRTHAYSNDRSISDVARDVVTRRLRLEAANE